MTKLNAARLRRDTDFAPDARAIIASIQLGAR